MLPRFQEITADKFENLAEAVNSDANPIKYLGIDPGKSNGVCGFDSRYYLQFIFVIPAKEMTDFMSQFKKVDVCVIEDFKLFPNKARQQFYSDMETSRVIGRVESWAANSKVNLIKQGSSIKTTGYKWIGEKPLPKTNPQNHAMDAYVHFMYWAIKNNRISAADLIRDKRPFL